MLRRNDQIDEAIVALGEGQDHPLRSTIEGDSKLARRLSSMKSLMALASDRFYDAPEGLRSRVVALMPTLVATRLSSSRLALGVRSNAEGWQSVYDVEGGRLRIAFSPTPEGWDVRGQSDLAGVIEIADRVADVAADGRFQLSLGSLPTDATFAAT